MKQKVQSLRIKTILIVGGSISGFLAVIYLFAGVILWQGFSRLERREADTNIERIRNRVNGELLTISSKVRDWASWDDAWNFMLTRDKTFAMGNLDPNTTLANLNADLLFYITPKRELVASLQWDPFNGKSMPVDKELTDLILSEKFNASWSDWNNGNFEAKGIITVSGVSWLMASRSVTKTDHTGEIRGTFFLAERVTPKRIQTIADELQFSIKFRDRSDKRRKIGTTYTRSIINTGVTFQNYDSTPAFSLEVKFNREVMEQGRLTLISMLALITAAALGIAFLILSQLDRRILQRLESLRRGAQKITTTGSTKELLKADGNDEIQVLASSINHMVVALEQRTNEIRDIFQNVKFGFFLIDFDGVILKGHTASSLQILRTDSLSGRSLGDVLNFTREQKMLLQLTLMQITEDLIPDDVSLNQLPKRVSLSDRTISLEAALVRDENQLPNRILVSIADATVLETAEQENRSNQTILTILRGKQAFASLLFDLSARQSSLETMAEAGTQNQLRQELHTLNGNLRCFDLQELVKLVSTIEDQPTIPKTDVHNLFERLKKWVSEHSTITGISWQNTQDSRTWEVSDQFLEQIKTYDPISEDLQAFKDWIVEEIRTKPLHDLASPFDNLVQTTAMKLGKIIQLNIVGSQLRVSPEAFQVVADMLPHILRNAIDHGIESPEERITLGKNSEGQIQLMFGLGGRRNLNVSIRDDGRGIDTERLVAKAAEKGLLTPAELVALSEEEKMRLIFHPGLSSKEFNEEISGRGHGMSAVLERIEDELGGAIQVTSTLGAGVSITMTIPQEPSPRQDRANSDSIGHNRRSA